MSPTLCASCALSSLNLHEECQNGILDEGRESGHHSPVVYSNGDYSLKRLTGEVRQGHTIGTSREPDNWEWVGQNLTRELLLP